MPADFIIYGRNNRQVYI